MAKVQLTEEQKQKKKEAAQRYKENQKEAKDTLKVFLASHKADLEDNVVKAIEYLTGAGKAERVSRPGVNDVLKQALMEAPSGLTAIEVFEQFEFGRPTMEQKIRTFIKAKNPEDRVWIAFEDGAYHVKGTGENPPEGWTGYLPVVKEDL